jgi:glycosyltransferase involved in cell wall biosynthesis
VESPDAPLVSVITVVLNGARNLARTLESVQRQSYPNLEYIVVDGGSTDGSVDILREHDASIDYWISEPDRGIYDAMNKGIGLASGSIIGILNSDDCYAPDAVEACVQALRDSSAGYCYGWVRLLDKLGREVGLAKPVPRRLFSERVLRETPLPHPTMFVRRSVYESVGGFDPSLLLAGDFELVARIHAAGIPGVEIPRVLVDYRLGGASANPLILREIRRTALRGGLSPFLAWCDWLTARLVMAAKSLLPSSVAGWMRAWKDRRYR